MSHFSKNCLKFNLAFIDFDELREERKKMRQLQKERMAFDCNFEFQSFFYLMINRQSLVKITDRNTTPHLISR